MEKPAENLRKTTNTTKTQRNSRSLPRPKSFCINALTVHPQTVATRPPERSKPPGRERVGVRGRLLQAVNGLQHLAPSGRRNRFKQAGSLRPPLRMCIKTYVAVTHVGLADYPVRPYPRLGSKNFAEG